MRPPCRRSVASFSFVALALSGRLALAEAEPPPPTDAELSKYIGVVEALAGDAAHAAEYCAALAQDAARESTKDDDLATIGRKIDAHPILSPQLRKQGLSGRRYAEISVQVAGVLIGAAMADEADSAARAQGKPAGNRDILLSSTPAAKPILARQQDLTKSLTKLEALCGGDEEEESEDEEADEGSEG